MQFLEKAYSYVASYTFPPIHLFKSFLTTNRNLKLRNQQI